MIYVSLKKKPVDKKYWTILERYGYTFTLFSNAEMEEFGFTSVNFGAKNQSIILIWYIWVYFLFWKQNWILD